MSEASRSTAEHLHITIVGDYDARIHTHRAIDDALAHVRDAGHGHLAWRWVHTTAVSEAEVRSSAGVWLAPASPYQSMDGALRAIRTAREHHVPFLGVCGGFQHAVIEFARNRLGLTHADHAEIAPDAEELAIVPLSCSLVGATGVVFLDAQSRLASIYARTRIVEGYFCSYGVNPGHADAMDRAGLRIVGRDEAGDVRAVELHDHPFFIGTLFQPQLGSRPGAPAPVVRAFVDAAFAHAASHGYRPVRAPHDSLTA